MQALHQLWTLWIPLVLKGVECMILRKEYKALGASEVTTTYYDGWPIMIDIDRLTRAYVLPL